MKLNDLTSNYETRIARVNRWLEETYGFKVYDKVSLEELYKVKADLDTQRENLKLSLPFNSYHQNPEYAKNILLSEAVVLMIGQIDNAELVEATLTIDVDPGTATRAEKVCADNNVTCGMEDGKFVMKGEERDILRVCYKMRWPANIYQGKIKQESVQEDHTDQPTEVVKEQDELEQAEVILASKQLVDEIQQIIEKLGKMQNDELGAIVDQMTYQHGADTAVSFNDAVSSSLENLLTLAKETKESLNNEVLKLQGEVPASDMSSAGDEEETSIDDQMDDEEIEPADSDISTDGDEAASGPEEEPLGRAKKS